MSEELWTEVHSPGQEAVIKTIPKEKKCKMEKWLPEKALQITVKRREVKGKGEKERYSHRIQSSKEQQGEIRKPSSVINAKKYSRLIYLILASGAARHLPAHLPDTRQRSRATPACSDRKSVV